MANELVPLSKKHQRVLDEYLKCWKQWEAYQRIYPNTTYDSAKSLSSNLFTDVNFSAHLQIKLEQAHMSADEALKLTADIARGDIGDFMSIGSDGFNLDLEYARNAGITSLIKKVKQQTVTINGKRENKEIVTMDIELYDRQIALRDFLKIHGKLINRIEGSGPSGEIEHIIKVYIPKNDRET